MWEPAVSILSGTDFSYCRFAQSFPCVLAIDHLFVMELSTPVPDVPLWEPSAAVTPVTAVSTNVVSQLAQSVVEVSHPDTLPVQP